MKKIKPVYGWMIMPQSGHGTVFTVYKNKDIAYFFAGFGKTVKVKIIPIKRRKKK